MISDEELHVIMIIIILCEIKPDYFQLGLGKKLDLIYVIYFSFAENIVMLKLQRHISYRENENLTSTIHK